MYHVLNMMGMREHIHGLDPFHGVPGVQEMEIPGLGRRVAAYINDYRRRDLQDLPNQFLLHPGPGRISDDHIGPPLSGKKIAGTNICHVAGEEIGMVDMIELGVLFGIAARFSYKFHANDPCRLFADEDTNAACPAIQIVHRFPTR